MKNVWHKIVEFHKGRLLFNLTNLTDETHEEKFNYHFDRAKKLSDFVGVIIRWSIVHFAGLFFFQRGSQSEFWLAQYAYFASATVAFAATVYFAVHVTILILLFWAGDVTRHQSRIFRRFIAAFALLNTALLYIGINQLVGSIAKASQLLGSNNP